MEKIVAYFANNAYLYISLSIIFLILIAIFWWKKIQKVYVEEIYDDSFDFAPTPIEEYGEDVSFLNERVAEMFKLKIAYLNFLI